MPAYAWGTSQKADVMLWNIYSLSKRAQVWSLDLCSPNWHLKYFHRCPKPENWIYTLCSPAEAKFNSVWSLTTTVTLHQSRTQKNISCLKSLRFHQKEKDHSTTESNYWEQLKCQSQKEKLALWEPSKQLFLPSGFIRNLCTYFAGTSSPEHKI